MFIAVSVAGAVALVVIVAGIFSVRTETDLLEDRLLQEQQADDGSFGYNIDNYEEEQDEATSLRERAMGSLDEALNERDWGKKVRTKLARADLKLTVAEYALLHPITMAGLFMISFFLIFRGNLVLGVLSTFIGFFVPRIYVARQAATRLHKFEAQLPDTLGLWVNALRSGYGVLQAMDAIARDAPEPTATEFKRVVREVSLGIDVDDALEHMLERVDSEDLDLVITAVNIQREVGGNLAEILEVIAHTVRERIKLKGEIRVLTTQGRVTGYLISGLPIVLALFLNVVSSGFISPMFENRACGWPMIGVGFALIGMGTAVIQKIVDIEI
jgi:tight adherence protein B